MQSTTGSFPAGQRWCYSRARSTVTQKGFKPRDIRVKEHKGHHFSGAECFVCLEDSILESSPASCLSSQRGHREFSPSPKRPSSDSLHFLGTAPWFPTRLPLSDHLGSLENTSRGSGASPNKGTASAVARLLFHCRLVQCLT